MGSEHKMKARTRRALVCAPQMPEFDRESGSRRVFHEIEFLQEAGWAVTFIGDNLAGGERYARLLRQRGIAVWTGFDAHTDDMVASSGFDIAILAFWQLAEGYLPRIRSLSQSTRVVVDAIDLHFIRSARQALRTRPDGVPAELVLSTGANFMRELNTYALADAVLAVSQKEAQLISDMTADPGLGIWVPDAEDLDLSPIPLGQRSGILFLGNFRHKPNVDAAEYLCREIVPRLDDGLLGQHHLAIVGNDLDNKMLGPSAGLRHVSAVGWVPSVIPYLERARVSVIPLLYGAGTKRKLIQALMTGTPTVSTSIGIEGLDVRHRKDVLVANEPAAFARAIETLLVDDDLWHRLALSGRERIKRVHGREAVRDRFLNVIEGILRRAPKTGPAQEFAVARRQRLTEADYLMLKERISEVATAALPKDATVAVVSRGDPELLQLGGIRAWHFPQNEQGEYLGHHPQDSAAAIDELERTRLRGAEFLILPSSSFWWLDHYRELAAHLEERYRRLWADESCIVFELGRSSDIATNGNAPPTNGSARTASVVAQTRPLVLAAAKRTVRHPRRTAYSVLVLGVYLADRANHVDDIVGLLADTRACQLTQRWLALQGAPPTKRVAEATKRNVPKPAPKYELLNGLLIEEDLERYDYVLTVDDDILMPRGFLDVFIPLQAKLDFAIAQPARTSGSYIDHPIVEQQRGVIARQTLFVEIGPVVSFHRSIYHMVFPFDTENPMGWGYENVWAYRLREAGLRMGIIDATPVDHKLRKPAAHYSWQEANAERTAYLAARPHLTYEDCFHVLDVVGLDK